MLSHDEQGQGPALVLIHAFPLDRSMWGAQANYFSADFRVIVPDIRGFGKSAPASPWTIEAMGEEILDLLDRLGIARCALGGLSMGGYIALPFCRKYPQRVEKLILADTRARADNETEKKNRSEMIAALKRKGIQAIVEPMLKRLLRENPEAEVAAWVRAHIEKTNPIAAAFAVAAMRDRPDCTALLPEIRCPALVITGDSDAVISVDESQAMAKALAHGTLAVLPGAGHLSNLENPEGFNGAVESFLGA